MSYKKYESEEKEASVILAIRNEEGYIRKCLDSLINQNFSHEKYEIIVIDGMSNDNTRKIVSEYQDKFPNFIRTFDNPKIKPAFGRNIGIEHAKGKTVIIFSGHAYAHREYLNILIKTLDSLPPDVVGVGGVHESPEDETFLGKITAEIQNTLIGGGPSSYRKKEKSSYVNTAAYVAYKKDIIKKIGMHDESVPFAEDLDLNWRLRKAGYKLMVTPEAKVYYYRKYSSIKLFPSRIYKYAVWEAIMMKKHPSFFNILFLIPVILSLSVVAVPAFMFLYSPLAVVILLGLGIYFMAILASSIHLVIRHGNVRYLISIPMYLIEHFSFGMGFITGLFMRVPKREQ